MRRRSSGSVTSAQSASFPLALVFFNDGDGDALELRELCLDVFEDMVLWTMVIVYMYSCLARRDVAKMIG